MWIRSPRLVLSIFGIILLEDLNRKIMGVENLIKICTRNLKCMRINQEELDKNNKQVHLGKTLECMLPRDLESKPAGTEHDNSVNKPKHGYGKDKLLQIGDKVRLDPSKQQLNYETCLTIKRLGLNRHGKRGGIRLKTHMDIVHPLGVNINNLTQIKTRREEIPHGNDKPIMISLFNAQAICNKEDMILDHLLHYKVDLGIIMET